MTPRSTFLVVVALTGYLPLSTGCESGSAVTAVAVKDPPIVVAPPARGRQLTFGPFDVPRGDVQLCRTLKLDNDKPIAVNRLDLKMLRGSHHFILFRAQQKPTGGQYEYPDQVFDCKGTINFDEWEFMMDVNQGPPPDSPDGTLGGTNLELQDGQGMIFQPHAQLLLQAHFLNATSPKAPVQAPQGGYDVLNMYETDVAAVQHEIRGMFTVDTNIAIPPHASDWRTNRRCAFTRTVHIVAMTGHFHNQGRTFRVEHEDAPDQTPLKEIYCTGTDCSTPEETANTWDHPLFRYFNPPLEILGSPPGSVEGLNFTCSYDNQMQNEDNTIYFGGIAETQEHCNLFFQYYVENPENNDPLHCTEGSGGW